MRFECLVLILLLSCSRQAEDTMLAIKNVNVIDVVNQEIIYNVDVAIQGHYIVQIGQNLDLEASSVLDATNKYLVPGLFDCHAHTGDYKSDFPRFIHFGVTSIFVPGGSTCTPEYYMAMRDMGEQDSIPAPRVFHTSQHFTMNGRHPVKTYSNSNWQEGKSVYFLRDTSDIPGFIDEVARQPIMGIKLTIEDGPHPPFVPRIPQYFIDRVTMEAHDRDLAVYAHVSDNIELEMALDAGIRNIVHFTGVDIDFDHDTEIIEKIQHNQLSWVTTLMLDKSFVYPMHPEWIKHIGLMNIYDDEALEEANEPGFQFRAETYIDFMKGYLQDDSISLQDLVQFQVDDIRRLKNLDVNFVLGTDTGNSFIFPGYSLHEEMQLLALGGMTPIEILTMGTINAAKMMKTDDVLGSIEEGKKADVILLNENPLEDIGNALSISKVIKNGQIQNRLN